MQIMINIPEKLYNRMKTYQGLDDTYVAVKHGTPLPKGHGRIGDLDALRKEVSSWGMNDHKPLDFINAIDQADAIIEADRESEEV